MKDFVLLLLTALGSYLLGAVPFGYLVARLRGIDIFKEGSGNIGATNVGRVLGRKFGLLVFTLDLLKGAVPVLVAWWLAVRLEPNLPGDTLAVAAGVMAFLGHLYPIYLRFQGGKGVATGTGAVVVLLPIPILAGFIAWLAAVSASRIVSFASLIAAVVLCAMRLMTTPQPFSSDNIVLTLFCLLASLMVFVRHHENIHRLLAGNENRLKDTRIMMTFSKILHVLALGLWFGMGVFFSFVVAFSLFGSFEKIASREEKDPQRPAWFPVSSSYEKPPPSQKFPDPLRKEQGTRAAGYVIGPMFDWYFILQAACAVIAVLTAVGWTMSGHSCKLHRLRAVVLVLALATVAAGWWMERKVSELRVDRDGATDSLLAKSKPTDDDVKATEQARATFGMWHGFSLLLNLGTLLLATIALALAVKLPDCGKQSASETGKPDVAG
jgi:acyl-phosphate glycerol 3-phosphate acyltransferase